jgi:hypothetical protein
MFNYNLTASAQLSCLIIGAGFLAYDRKVDVLGKERGQTLSACLSVMTESKSTRLTHPCST